MKIFMKNQKPVSTKAITDRSINPRAGMAKAGKIEIELALPGALLSFF